ncbi:MAG: LysE family translocator [Cellvibrionaceae bacterium]
MESYLIFFFIAVITILSPGPGVILTLTNTIRFGVSGALGGILGIASGTFIVAAVSATSLGILLATSALAFSIMKYIGAAYLFYLGVKLWRTPAAKIDAQQTNKKNKKLQFFEGITLQLTNPKAVFFFISIFPQFIDFASDYQFQFVLLVSTYSLLVVFIHIIYASLASKARVWLSSEAGGRRVNKLGGGTFMCFGVGLASASKSG